MVRKRSFILGGMVIIALIFFLVLIFGGFEKNEATNWQVVQKVRGKMDIRDQAGWYLKWFATITVYPRYVEKAWNDIKDEGDDPNESVRTTFNDGGTAQVSSYVRYSTPGEKVQRLIFHPQFSGNIENATAAVKAHLINCIKATGPLMSASEHQSARKAEYTQIIEDQLVKGLYKMRKVEARAAKQTTDANGVIVTTEEVRMATEIVTDTDGMPIIIKVSPLTEYGIQILQFSITLTQYDTETLKQFAAKKQSYLAAELSKADREMEIQERLMIVEQGLKKKAEAKAAADVIKETAVIAAQQKAEVAEQAKVEAETVANMQLAVAEIAKEEAQVKFETAGIDANAIIVLAKAEREKIELAGALTELETALINAGVKKASDVASALAQIRVPQVMIMGVGGAEGQSPEAIMQNLINLKLLEGAGLFDKINADLKDIPRTIDRSRGPVEEVLTNPPEESATPVTDDATPKDVAPGAF